MIDEIMKCFKNELALPSTSELLRLADEVILVAHKDFLNDPEDYDVVIDNFCKLLQASKLIDRDGYQHGTNE